ncbi:AsmA family protein [Desulfuromonas sp. AOP6]|uniref:AsmA family protein n=1 Tax=Desulfuromonas sp. AOP6 TaxID=1566351 RepID=UPI0012836180|nr:AsmA family protein [Desulfuromonas sp. AOP6]BCA80036.1 hypothetical protein AOP6_1823 [Desulfuromonas sp. AOP6]
MKKVGKIAAIVLAVLVALGISIGVLAKILITPERVKDTVLPLAEKSLNRKVELGEVQVSLFSGISLSQLRIGEAQGDEYFVTAEKLVLRYRFWPLLFMKVVVDEVRLEEPRIRVERLQDGSFNFSDLMAAKNSSTEEMPSSPGRESDGKDGGIDLLISRVVLNGGEVLFLDRSFGGEAPYRYKVSGLNVSARDISLDKDFPFSLEAVLGEATLAVAGKTNVATASGEASLKLSPLDITPFTPYFRQQLPGRLDALQVALDLAVKGGSAGFSSHGKVSLTDLDILLDALKDVPVRDASLLLDYDLDINLTQKALDIRPTTLTANGIVARMQGRVSNYGAVPQLDMTVELPDLDVRSALRAAPAGLLPDLGDLDPAGKISARINLAGTADDPLKLLRDGEVVLSGVQASMASLRPALTGRLALKGDAISAQQLELKMGDTTAAINLKVSNLFGKPLRIENSLTADRLHLDPLLQGAGSQGAAAAEAGSSTGKASEEKAGDIGPFDLPLVVSGEARIGQTVYRGMNIENMVAKYRLENNIFTLETLTGSVAGGTFTEKAVVDLGKKGLVYDSTFSVQGAQMNPLISAFLPKSADTVQGGLDLHLILKGKGVSLADIRRNLSGSGDFLFKDGKLSGSALVKGLAEFLSLEELREINVRESAGSFAIEKGKVLIQSTFAGSNARFSPKGALGMDGSLDLSLDLRLSPELSRKLDNKGKVSQFLTDSDGWGLVPLRLAGTLDKPRFGLDTSAAKEQVKEKAAQELQRQLEKKLFKGDEPAAGESDPAKDAGKKVLEDTIRGLFGR